MGASGRPQETLTQQRGASVDPGGRADLWAEPDWAAVRGRTEGPPRPDPIEARSPAERRGERGQEGAGRRWRERREREEDREK